MKKKALYLIAAAVAALIAVSSCTPKPPPEPSVLSVEVDNGGVVGADEGVVNIRVTSNVSWTVSKAEADSWITLGVDKGENEGVVEVSFEANPESSEREAVITFRSESIDNPTTVTIKQAAASISEEERIVTNFTDALVIYSGYEDIENWYLSLCFDGATFGDDLVATGPGAYLLLDLFAEVGSGSEYIPNGTYTLGEAKVPGAITIKPSAFIDLDVESRSRFTDGTVIVARSGEVYEITFNLKTTSNIRLKGTYKGTLRYIRD